MPPGTADYILDTSAVILLMRRGIKCETGACFTFVTLAELCAGALKSVRAEREQQRIDWTLEIASLLYPTRATIGIYSRLWTQLEQIGRPLPTNDLWTAAIAIEWNLPLHARDAHFSEIPGLIYVEV